MMVDSNILGITGLIVGFVVLLYLIYRLRTGSAVDVRLELPNWGERLFESSAWVVVQAVLTLVLMVSVGGVIGVVVWETMKGIVEAVKVLPAVLAASISGAMISSVGFGFFAIVSSLLSPIMFVVYEKWTWYMAPVIGGAVGAAMRVGSDVNVIYIVALSAMTGGIILLLYEMVIEKEKVTIKRITDTLVGGVGFGFVNGVIVAAVFKVLEIVIGVGWLMAG
jgi:hypothetical protein